jgi:K+-sensing histidine kinase KdpD
MADDLKTKLAGIRGTLDAVHQELESRLEKAEADAAAWKAKYETLHATLKNLLEPPAPPTPPA